MENKRISTHDTKEGELIARKISIYWIEGFPNRVCTLLKGVSSAMLDKTRYRRKQNKEKQKRPRRYVI